MNYTTKRKRHITIALALFFSLLGVIVADAVALKDVVLKGILGITVLVLIIHFGVSTNTNKTLDSVFVFPENIIYFVYAFFGVMVAYWAAGYVYEMIMHFVYR
jgi:hypothetical protein